MTVSHRLGVSFLLFVCAGSFSTSTSAQDYRYGMITQTLDNTEADTVQRTGIGWVLLNFNWNEVDGRCVTRYDLPGCRNYDMLDRMVDSAAARGLEVLADLSYTAAWANGTGLPQSPPLDLRDYYDYVFDIVTRYSPRVNAWKIWNEPNLPAFLAPADQWMPTYKTYVTLASAAIRRVDPTAVIVGPDLSYHALAGGSLSPFSQIMADYGSSAFDIVSVHHYDDDEVPLGVRLDESVAAFRRGKPVWVTETGQRWSTFAQTPEKQQAFYLRALADCDDRAWVTNVFFYQLIGDDFFNVTVDGVYESAFPALRSYERWIKNGRDAAFESAGVAPQDPSAGTIDAATWAIGVVSGSSDHALRVSQFGRQIHIGPLRAGTSGTHANGVMGRARIDLTDAILSAKIVTPPSVDGNAYAVLILSSDPSNQLRARVQTGRISFEQTVRSVTTKLGETPFSLTDTAYVRIRHDAGTDRVSFETMTAGGIATVQASVKRLIDIQGMTLALEAGTSSVERVAPGTVVFDRITVPQP